MATATVVPSFETTSSGGDITVTGQVLAANGTAAAPSYAFTNDPDVGAYRTGTNGLGLSNGGTLALTISGAQLGLAAGAWQFPAGTGSLPGVSTGGTTEGLFQQAASVLGLAAGGAEVARLSATLLQVPAATYLTFTGRAKLGSLVDNQLQVLPNGGGGSTAQLLFNTADGNGSKIRNNGGGIINFEDGNSTGLAAQTRAGQYLNNNGTYGLFFNTSAAFGNGNNSTTTFCGLATASLTSLAVGSTQNISFYGTGGQAGTNTGAALNLKTVAANTTLSLGGTTTTIVQIPAGSIVMAVTARVTTTITAALSTSWSLAAGAVTYATGKGFATTVTVTSADYQATFVGPTFYAAATNLVVTMNTDAATAGAIRCVVHYFDTTAPTA